MNVVGINCSQRKESNSEKLLDYVLDKLSGRFAVEKVNALELSVACNGCESCFADFCFHADGIAQLHNKMLQADVIIYSSPTYFGMPPVLAKIIMDRTNQIWLERGFKGKLGAVIINGASPFGAIELNAKNFMHFCYDHEMITVPFYACFNNSFSFAGERFPYPFSEEFAAPLDKLVRDIEHYAWLLHPEKDLSTSAALDS